MAYVERKKLNTEVCSGLLNVIGTTSDKWSTIKNENLISRNSFLRKRKIPDKDVQRISPDQFVTLTTQDDPRLVSCKNILGAATSTNAIVYPKKSVMGWHTNSNNLGTRVYYTYTMKQGIFRYRDPETGLIIDDYDDIGWTCRSFLIQKDIPLWHTIWTEGIRFSFGFNISE